NRTAPSHRPQTGNSVGGSHSQKVQATKRTGNAARSSGARSGCLRGPYFGGGNGGRTFLSGQNSVPASRRKSWSSCWRSRRREVRVRANSRNKRRAARGESAGIKCLAGNCCCKPKRVAGRTNPITKPGRREVGYESDRDLETDRRRAAAGACGAGIRTERAASSNCARKFRAIFCSRINGIKRAR